MIAEKTVGRLQTVVKAERTEMAEVQHKETPDFICRVCGSKEFKEVSKSNEICGPGGRSWRVYCVCLGCSVIFENPEKFSIG